uniref:Uncharacterized protein n=1 Tax=Ditylenchus dipsaci TaxID=166011 RepID=A0A915CLG4_9BILA
MNTYIAQRPSTNLYSQAAVPPEPSSATDALVKTHSIDAVIDRVHLVASNINELTHVASDNIKKVGDQAAATITSFNNHFSNVGTEFNKIIVLSREKSSSIPLVLLYIGLICGTIAIFLAVLQFAAMGFHKLFQTYKYKSAVQSEETNTAAVDGEKTSKPQQDPTNLRVEEM